jgi:hypothetical protein
MGYLIDQTDKSTSNYQALLDFCTRDVRGIALVRKWIKLRKGKAIIKLFYTFALGL